MKKQAALSVVGRDKPGIVAGISKALFETGCNILDSSMTILGSEFAMILMIQYPSSLSSAKLQKAVTHQASKLKLSFSLKPVKLSEIKREKLKGSPYLISVYGADKPGIVFKVADFLSKNKINITDLQTNISGKNVYIMMIEADIPKKTSIAGVRTSLEKLASGIQVSISINPIESYKL